MQLPSKLQTGQNFKQATVRTVNNIIDYLKTQRLIGDNKTITVNQLTSGIALSVPQSGGGGAGGGTPANFPFKLYVSTDENDKPCICMQQGRILIQSTQSMPVAYRYEPVEQGDTGSTPMAPCLPIDWDTQEDGFYLVIGVFRALYQNNQLGFQGKCLVVGGSINVEDIPCCEGYLSFYIGTIEKSTSSSSSSSGSSGSSEDVPDYTLRVVNNRIKSDLIVTDFMQHHPFGVYALIDHGDVTQVKTDYTDWTITGLQCNSGIVYDDLTKQSFTVSEDIFVPSSGSNYLYLVFDKEDEDVYLQWTTTLKEDYVLDADDEWTYKNYLIATVIIVRNTIGILQNINNDLIFNQGDTYRIKIDNGNIEAEDLAPNFAVSKLYGDFGTLQEDTQSEYAGYIGVYEQQNAYSEKLGDLALKWKWCYDLIDGYANSGYLQLNVQDDMLQWQDAYLVRVNSNDNNPDYLINKIDEGTHIQFQTLNGVIGINATPPNITGVSPIIVAQDQQTGWDFTISFDDTGFVKSIVNGTCITSSRSGTAVTINVDKTCVFQNFSISATSPITVSGSGQSWTIGFNDSGFLKSLSEGTCIDISRSGTNATISVDKTCIFQNFSITASSPLSVSGSGQSWTIGFNGSVVQTITSQDGTVSITRSGSTVDLSVPNIGKVQLYQGDTFGYLWDKFANENGIIEFYLDAGGIDAKLGPYAIESPDQSIDVNITSGGIAQLDVDWSKLVIDQSLAPLISKSVSNHVCTLSLNAPANGKYVLMANNGSVSWVAVGQCPGEEQEQPGDAIPNLGDDPNANENDGEE